MEHISKMTKSTSVPNSFFSAGLGFPCLSIREKQNRNLKVAAEFQAEAGWKGFGSQYISEAAERPHALLNENSGASHGQNSRSTGLPSAMKRLMRLFASIHTLKCLTLASLLLASSLSVVSRIPPTRFERASA